MLRLLLQVSLAGSLTASVVACGGTDKPVKTAKPAKVETNKKGELLSEARDEARAGDVDGADEAYAAAYALGQEFDVLEEHVDFLIHAGRPARAQAVAKVYYEENANDARGIALYADALLAGNKGREALAITDQMVAADENDAAAREKRGRALLLLDKDQEGIAELRRAVQIEPKNATYHMSLGSALHKIGEVNEAALEFRAALKHAPEDPKAHVLLGMALRDQNELDESRQYLDKALDLDPENGRAYFELGLLLNRQGKQALAEDSLARAVKHAPNESLFWYAYGEIFRLQQRTEEALNAYRTAVELDPPYPKAIGKLAQLLIARKQYGEAEVLLIKAIRRDPENATGYLYLGDVYADTRKYKPAIENFEKFLELAPANDPDRDRAKREIRALKRKR